MIVNALWGWLDLWKKTNWKHRGKPIWAADLPQDIATQVEKLTVRVRHVDAHVPKNRANEEHHNNKQADRDAQVEVSQVDLDWQHKGELFLVRWAHDASGHQGRDTTYRWVDLTMDTISQVIHGPRVEWRSPAKQKPADLRAGVRTNLLQTPWEKQSREAARSPKSSQREVRRDDDSVWDEKREL
ncbi:hypothetical protein BTVI_02794 [Pitangus sulphuratus]|nr:hypothetical protein BTVI_02794 [Pitangus sulphuratus]